MELYNLETVLESVCGQRQRKAAGAAIVVVFPNMCVLSFVSLWLLQPVPPWISCRFQTRGCIAQGCIVQLGKKIGTKNIVKPSELHVVFPGLQMMLLQFHLS